MEYKINIKTSQILKIFNNALDLVSPLIAGHQVRVAYISYNIAKQYGLSKERIDRLVKAAVIHDIGATKVTEATEIIREDFESNGRHEKAGAEYLKNSIFKNAAIIVRHHHRAWNKGEGKYYNGEELPIECQIIHLADRIETYIDKNGYILTQVDEITNKVIERKDIVFMPELVDSFLELSINESFWLYTISNNVLKTLFEDAMLEDLILNIDELYEVTKWFANIIDFRSRYTAVHSRGVSASAGAIARAMNLEPEFVKILEIAGFIHDLGKLAVPNSILEKNGKLDKEEFAIIRCHTFYTYNILSQIDDPNFQLINEYGAYHHEKIDGTGYPFHKKGDEIKLGSRIMAVADVFTAIAEDRPYRKAMEKEEIIAIMEKIGNDKYLDSTITKALIDNYDEIFRTMKTTQEAERKEYEEFWANI